MAETWYLEMDTVTLEGREPRYRSEFKECIELFKLSPERWKCEPDNIPNLKTGNSLIDQIGYAGVLVRVTQDEIEALLEGKEKWKPGWYLSPLTPVGAEKNLAKKRTEGTVYSEG
jgi:hypothetical protein